MDNLPIILVLLGAALLIALSTLLHMVRVQQRRLTEANSLIGTLNANLNALCAGAVGVDQRVSSLEQHGRDLQHRLESMETRNQGDRPYGEAIHMVHQGATPHRLVEELGLSRSEADLVAMLHGMKKAG